MSFSSAFQADAFQNDAFQVVSQPVVQPRRKKGRSRGGARPIVPWTPQEQQVRQEVFSGISAQLGALMRDEKKVSAELGLVMTETPSKRIVGAALLGAAIDDS